MNDVMMPLCKIVRKRLIVLFCYKRKTSARFVFWLNKCTVISFDDVTISCLSLSYSEGAWASFLQVHFKPRASRVFTELFCAFDLYKPAVHFRTVLK